MKFLPHITRRKNWDREEQKGKFIQGRWKSVGSFHNILGEDGTLRYLTLEEESEEEEEEEEDEKE